MENKYFYAILTPCNKIYLDSLEMLRSYIFLKARIERIEKAKKILFDQKFDLDQKVNRTMALSERKLDPSITLH